MLSFCCRKHDRGNRTENTRRNENRATALPAMPAIVFDAELNSLEEVRALFGGRDAGEQRVAQACLNGGHAITTEVASGSTSSCAPNVRSSASRPRPRCVLTELREMPRVDAMSSIPSSS